MKALVIYLAILTLSIPTNVSSCSTQTEFEPLPEFSVDNEFITVSGISAGAAFATQVLEIKRILQDRTVNNNNNNNISSSTLRSAP